MQNVTHDEILNICNALMNAIKGSDGEIDNVRSLPKEACTSKYHVVEIELKPNTIECPSIWQKFVLNQVPIPGSYIQTQGLWNAQIAKLFIPKQITNDAKTPCNPESECSIFIKKSVSIAILLVSICGLQYFKTKFDLLQDA